MNKNIREKYRKTYIGKNGVIDFTALKKLYASGLLKDETSPEAVAE